ncbi:hypothetical protein ACWGCW_32920 [Streptomyces sp. NPDC054933]
MDGTLVPTRDRSVAASSKNYRYSANMQVLIKSHTKLVLAGHPPAQPRQVHPAA